MDADVAAVVDFVAKVRANCRALVVNPFNVDAGETLADLLEVSAPVAEEALLRVTHQGCPGIDLLLDAVEAI